MNCSINDFKNFQDAFRFIENLWAVSTKVILEINN